MQLIFLRKMFGRRTRCINPKATTGRQRLFRLLLLLFVLILIHTLGMVVFEKDMGWWDAFWLSWSTATTVGYGDLSAVTTLGRITTILLMYSFGISLLAQLASEYIEYRIDMRERKIKGQWEWKKMQNHILIINTPKDGAERYLTRLISQIRLTPSLQNDTIQLLTRSYPDGLPKALAEYNVVHFDGQSENVQALTAVHANHAKHIFLIARDENDPLSDSLTFDILDRIQEMGTSATITVEAIEDDNRQRFYRMGAKSVIRPIRAYPELVARAMASPGTEQILENLFSHRGDHPHRFDVTLDATNWKELACKVMMQNMGTPLGYITHEGAVKTNPNPTEPVQGQAILILVHQDHVPSQDALQDCIHS